LTDTRWYSFELYQNYFDNYATHYKRTRNSARPGRRKYLKSQFMSKEGERERTVISISTKQSLSISTPSQTETVIILLSLSFKRFQLFDDTLALQIPNHDTTARGSTKPVSSRRETQCVNLIFGFKGVEMFWIVEVPEHGCAVFSAWSTERAIGGDGDGVDVSGVAVVISAEFAFGQFPNLLQLSAQVQGTWNV